MKDRTVCTYYICKGMDCGKGIKNVDMAKCKNCCKYRPRKTTKREEPYSHKKYKSRIKHYE